MAKKMLEFHFYVYVFFVLVRKMENRVPICEREEGEQWNRRTNENQKRVREVRGGVFSLSIKGIHILMHIARSHIHSRAYVDYRAPLHAQRCSASCSNFLRMRLRTACGSVTLRLYTIFQLNDVLLLLLCMCNCIRFCRAKEAKHIAHNECESTPFRWCVDWICLTVIAIVDDMCIVCGAIQI